MTESGMTEKEHLLVTIGVSVVASVIAGVVVGWVVQRSQKPKSTVSRVPTGAGVVITVNGQVPVQVMYT